MCQVQIDTTTRFPKPQVVGSIPTGGTSKLMEFLDLVQVCDARYSPVFSTVGGVSGSTLLPIRNGLPLKLTFLCQIFKQAQCSRHKVLLVLNFRRIASQQIGRAHV